MPVPSKAIRIAAIAAVAAGIAAGALTFASALEPGRSERDGLVLAGSLKTGDWYPGSSQTRITARGGRLTLEARQAGFLLVSRTLPLDPDRCYQTLLRARAVAAGIQLAIMTENLDRVVAITALSPTPRPVTHRLTFRADGRRRVSATILGTRAGRTIVAQLALLPRPC